MVQKNEGGTTRNGNLIQQVLSSPAVNTSLTSKGKEKTGKSANKQSKPPKKTKEKKDRKPFFPDLSKTFPFSLFHKHRPSQNIIQEQPVETEILIPFPVPGKKYPYLIKVEHYGTPKERLIEVFGIHLPQIPGKAFPPAAQFTTQESKTGKTIPVKHYFYPITEEIRREVARAFLNRRHFDASSVPSAP
ncbi:Uncharacterised protein [Candidatus Gugararchaeum adminiculabundum]|nr:Uncharacterised protein [Candidatus Gugararchaeum adminiculabundum]